jgi:hypothetical protein
MKTVRYVLRLTLTLLMITAVVAAALGGVNSITAPKIAQIQAEKIQAAVSQVLPGGGEELESFSDDTGTVQKVYASETGYECGKGGWKTVGKLSGLPNHRKTYLLAQRYSPKRADSGIGRQFASVG